MRYTCYTQQISIVTIRDLKTGMSSLREIRPEKRDEGILEKRASLRTIQKPGEEHKTKQITIERRKRTPSPCTENT